MIVTELFAKVPLFEGVSPEDRAALARAATLRTYRRGETIVQQGQPGDAFYVLVRGRVAVAIVAPDGREVVLNSLGQGDHFGEMALLDDAPRSASVIAQERSDLAILSRAVFLDLLKSNFVLTRALLGAFSARLRRANNTIEGLASLDVKSRLARYFRDLAASRGRRAGGGWSVRGPPLSARDRRHDRLLARDGVAHDVANGRRAAHRAEGQSGLRQARLPGSRTLARRSAGLLIRYTLRRPPWNCAPGRCRTS